MPPSLLCDQVNFLEPIECKRFERNYEHQAKNTQLAVGNVTIHYTTYVTTINLHVTHDSLLFHLQVLEN